MPKILPEKFNSHFNIRLIENEDNKDLEQLAYLRWQFKCEDNLNEIITACLDEKTFINECLRTLQQPDFQKQFTHFGVFHKENQMIGMASLGYINKIPEPLMMSEGISYLTNFYVRPSYRGQGLGSQLMLTIQSWCQKRAIELTIVWPSELSRPFYKRHFFRDNNQPLIWMCNDKAI